MKCNKQEAAFISYITQITRYKAMRLYKKYAKQHSHELLILDAPIDDHENCLGNLIFDPKTKSDFDNEENQPLEKIVANPLLYQAIANLSQYQKDVLNALIIKGISEESYARELGVSRQAINKVKKCALSKIRDYLKKGA